MENSSTSCVVLPKAWISCSGLRWCEVSYVWMMLARLSLPNHPPYRKRDAAQHTDGTQNEYDNKRLAYGSVECRQRSTSPVDPICHREV